MKKKMLPLIVESLLLSVRFAKKSLRPEHLMQKDDSSVQWNAENYHPVLKELQK